MPHRETDLQVTKQLCDTIRAYWQDRGYRGIRVWQLQCMGYRESYWMIKSNIGPLGFPPQDAPQPQPQTDGGTDAPEQQALEYTQINAGICPSVSSVRESAQSGPP